MLNWRRDPGYEQRMKQLNSDIEKETEQLRRENAKLRSPNARSKNLLSYVGTPEKARSTAAQLVSAIESR